MNTKRKSAQADWISLHRIFTVPEDAQSTLSQIERQISANLTGFLQEHIVAKQKDLYELEKDFLDFSVPDQPVFVSEHSDFLLEKVVAHSVHTASPKFIGHMTSALPYFMVSLSKIMMALNQNLVKIETSKVFTPLERQVLAMMHHLIYQREAGFYQDHMHHSTSCLGVFCSGGTIANTTALWIARNRAFPANESFSGVANSGLYRALKYYQYEGVAVLVSERGHYSLSKAADILGLGREDFVAIAVDDQHRVQINELERVCRHLQSQKIKILAIIGIAGSSETGSVDDLEAVARVARTYDAHYHVDAAWGGATLFSDQNRYLLKGIEQADSVTIDAHKQMYVPMGAGMVFLKEPHYADSVRHHAQYIVRKGSHDLGRYSMEGSRPGMAMLVQSGLRIMGRAGYAMLIDEGIKKAQTFAAIIESEVDFELVSAPDLNLLTYRYVPQLIQAHLKELSLSDQRPIQLQLNRITRLIQKTQRSRGLSFVSRTQFKRQGDDVAIVVFRVVLANPLTTLDMLQDILTEQKDIAVGDSLQSMVSELNMLCK